MTRHQLRSAALFALALAGAGGFTVSHALAEQAHRLPAPALDERVGARHTETAVLAGGCFWGVQGVFQHVDGVTSAVSGYAGGSKADAGYDTVSTGTTGHAEAVRVTFDPTRISYGRLLQIHFSVAHDPTELNRQGPDTGSQYRSAIFPTSAEQGRVAKAYIAQLDDAHAFGRPIVTRIEPGKRFYPAEAHHQNFLARNPGHPYIVANDLPKVRDLKRMFPQSYRQGAVLVAHTGTGE